MSGRLTWAGWVLYGLPLLLAAAGLLMWTRSSAPCRGNTGDTSTSPKQPVLLAVFVMSSPSHIETRETIRETWVKLSPGGVIVRFVIGTATLRDVSAKQLLEENTKYSDLVLLDHLSESYHSLTLKLLATLDWSVERLDMQFLMKVDEDTFVRPDRIVEELIEKQKERLYWGFFDGRAPVFKDGKWAEKAYVLCDHYIPYALGGGYILSGDLAQYIVNNAKYLKQFQSEDVSIGTWLGPLDIERIHDARFDTEYKSRGCLNSYLVTHKQTQDDMYRKYEAIKASGNLCTDEFQTRQSYIYDWSALPSKCCSRKGG